MNYIPLNWGLMANPYNWLILTLMVMIGGLAIAAIMPDNTSEGN